jgi:hypothetical protein
MIRSALRLLVLSLLAGALFASSASALNINEAKPVSHRFVKLVTHGAGHALRFTAKASRKYRGKRFSYVCHSVPDASGISVDDGGGSTITRTPIEVGVQRHSDWCSVTVTVSRVQHIGKEKIKDTRHLHQIVTVTAAGRAYRRRITGTEYLVLGVGLVYVNSGEHPKTFPSAPSIVAQLDGATISIVALAGPDAKVKPKQLGIWTDSAHRLHVAYALADGTQLYVDYDGQTHAFRTNVEDELQQVEHNPVWSGDSYGASQATTR